VFYPRKLSNGPNKLECLFLADFYSLVKCAPRYGSLSLTPKHYIAKSIEVLLKKLLLNFNILFRKRVQITTNNSNQEALTEREGPVVLAPSLNELVL